MSDSLNDLTTAGGIVAYIKRHEALLGFPPTAIGLPYEVRVTVLKEMGASDFAARCTNVTARLLNIPIVEVA